MIFFNVYKHILPRARAWTLTVKKTLREFFEGLVNTPESVKMFIDAIWLDIFPQTTREIGLWEDQFGLRDTGLDEQGRRDRLDAAWKSLGGQSPRYIQDTLQANGFDVYVHEWWEPGTEPPVGIKQCATPRNPLDYIRRSKFQSGKSMQCGEVEAQCGDPFAQCGNSETLIGYPLVNKVFQTQRAGLMQCGEVQAQCGDPAAQCGNFSGFVEVPLDYVVPDDPTKWPYFLYIGGENFPELATVSNPRKDEFERLCLKICPAHVWIGILVQYS
jgi:hypothetical protein